MLEICSTSIILTLLQKHRCILNQNSYSPSEPRAPYCGPPRRWWKPHIRVWRRARFHIQTHPKWEHLPEPRSSRSRPDTDTYANRAERRFREGQSLHPDSFMGSYGRRAASLSWDKEEWRSCALLGTLFISNSNAQKSEERPDRCHSSPVAHHTPLLVLIVDAGQAGGVPNLHASPLWGSESDSTVSNFRRAGARPERGLADRWLSTSVLRLSSKHTTAVHEATDTPRPSLRIWPFKPHANRISEHFHSCSLNQMFLCERHSRRKF